MEFNLLRLTIYWIILCGGAANIAIWRNGGDRIVLGVWSVNNSRHSRRSRYCSRHKVWSASLASRCNANGTHLQQWHTITTDGTQENWLCNRIELDLLLLFLQFSSISLYLPFNSLSRPTMTTLSVQRTQWLEFILIFRFANKNRNQSSFGPN